MYMNEFQSCTKAKTFKYKSHIDVKKESVIFHLDELKKLDIAQEIAAKCKKYLATDFRKDLKVVRERILKVTTIADPKVTKTFKFQGSFPDKKVKQFRIFE